MSDPVVTVPSSDADRASPARSATLRATLVGAVAVLLWGTLAPFTAASGAVPPFQLLAIAFAAGFLPGLAKWLLLARRGKGRLVLVALRQPARIWLIGIGGLFGFHLLYFLSLRHAPPAEANLINYMWPLLIVLFSAMLPGERLRWFHVMGALAGLVGAGLLVTGGGLGSFRSEHALGYGIACGSALVWSGYSLASRRFAHVPTDTVAGFCLATALLAGATHLLLEQTVWPQGWQWLAVLGLGLGPVGLAFYVWDYGVKHGDIQALGALAYGAPLISTILLVLFGWTEGRWYLWVACLLIVGGAALASLDMLQTRARSYNSADG